MGAASGQVARRGLQFWMRLLTYLKTIAIKTLALEKVLLHTFVCWSGSPFDINFSCRRAKESDD